MSAIVSTPRRAASPAGPAAFAGRVARALCRRRAVDRPDQPAGHGGLGRAAAAHGGARASSASARPSSSCAARSICRSPISSASARSPRPSSCRATPRDDRCRRWRSCWLISVAVGVINGAIIAKLQRQSADRDARRRPRAARPAVGELHRFCRVRAGKLSGCSPMARSARSPIRCSALFALRAGWLVGAALDAVRRASLCRRRQCRRCASGRRAHRSHHHPGACHLQRSRRHDRPLSGEPVAFGRSLGRARRRLRSRIRSPSSSSAGRCWRAAAAASGERWRACCCSRRSMRCSTCWGCSAFPKLVLRGAIVILAVAAYAMRSKEQAA